MNNVNMNNDLGRATVKSILKDVRECLERFDIDAAISQIEKNWSGGASRSRQNWRLRVAPLKEESGYITKSEWANSEVLLERTITDQCQRRNLPVWNQIPVASGLLTREAPSEGKRAIDLVSQHNCSEGVFEFIELKVGRKGPTDSLRHAAYELLEYGLLYLFSRKNQEVLGYAKQTENSSYRVLRANEIRLRVLARADYYEKQDSKSVPVGLINSALESYIQRNRVVIGNLSLSLGFEVIGDGADECEAFLNKQDWPVQEARQ